MPSNLLGLDEGVGVRVGEVALEDGLARHFVEAGADERVAEEGFRKKDDELVGSAHTAAVEQRGERYTYGFSELALVLSSEDMEVICWCSTLVSSDLNPFTQNARWVDYLHVAILMLTFELLWRWVDPRFVIAKLKEPFHAAGRVLRSLAIIPVG